MSSGLDFSYADAEKAADKVGIPKGKKRAPHRTDWYVLDGKHVLRVSIPRHKSGATGTRSHIVNSFKLSNSEFKRLYECHMSKSEYEEHIRRLIKDKQL